MTSDEATLAIIDLLESQHVPYMVVGSFSSKSIFSSIAVKCSSASMTKSASSSGSSSNAKDSAATIAVLSDAASSASCAYTLN